ncbi:hypothetical protein LTR95_002255 [Oleoguttula sp. CCFEE 5521]
MDNGDPISGWKDLIDEAALSALAPAPTEEESRLLAAASQSTQSQSNGGEEVEMRDAEAREEKMVQSKSELTDNQAA